MFCTVESDRSVPETTRNSVMRPANGSATVFHTKAAAGPLSVAATVTSSWPFGSLALNGRSAGGWHVGDDRVEQRLDRRY